MHPLGRAAARFTREQSQASLNQLSDVTTRVCASPAGRATARLTREHSRTSLMAATAATAGILGVSGAACAGAFSGPAAASVQLDALRSPGTAGGVTGAATAATTHVATAPAVGAATATAGHAVTAQAIPAATHAPAKAPAVKAHAATATTAKAAPAKAAPVKAAPVKAVVKPAAPRLMYDSVTPESLPHQYTGAVYANGAYAATAGQTAKLGHVLWIDTNGSTPKANVLDVEPGDATPAEAAAWAGAHVKAHPGTTAIIYTMKSQWGQVREHVSHLPTSVQKQVRYWIADPTGHPHIVPGSHATQWYWGSHVDISTALPSLES